MSTPAFSIEQLAQEAELSAKEFAGQTRALRTKREVPPNEVFALRAYRQRRKQALFDFVRAQVLAGRGAEAAE